MKNTKIQMGQCAQAGNAACFAFAEIAGGGRHEAGSGLGWQHGPVIGISAENWQTDQGGLGANEGGPAL